MPISQLKHLEKLMRLKNEMDINLEGIETTTYLLQRIKDLQLRMYNLLTSYRFIKVHKIFTYVLD